MDNNRSIKGHTFIKQRVNTPRRIIRRTFDDLDQNILLATYWTISSSMGKA